MEEKYCKEAFTLFDKSIQIFKHPHRAEDIENMESYLNSQLENYNENERKFIKDPLDEFLRKYKDEVSYFDMMFR